VAEFLVRRVDKVNPDSPLLNQQASKNGDVITAQEDGWGWTQRELENPDWIVFKLPGVSLAEYTGQCAA